MSCRICIEREGDKFEVEVTNPEIEKRNQAANTQWQDPCEEYLFDTWDEVVEFLGKIVDKALPPDEYSRAFDKAAKEVTGGK